MPLPSRTVSEPPRDTPVFLETDVLVCGGGPAGTAAALAADRQGVSVALLERYGHMGGLATGGLVIVLPCFLEGDVRVIGGIGHEIRERLLDTGEAAYRKSHRSDGSMFDPEALKRLSVEMCREQDVDVLHHTWQLGVRRTRRLIGEYVITDDDVSGHDRRFPDAIGRGNDFRKADLLYEIPFRAFVPRDIDGLLVAGRCLSCSHNALEPLREIHICWVMGQAVGTAAGIAVQSQVPARDISIPTLQHALRTADVPFTGTK